MSHLYAKKDRTVGCKKYFFHSLYPFPAHRSSIDYPKKKMAKPIRQTDIEEMIRVKLKERVPPGSSLLTTGFRLFGRPENGVTVDNFRHTLANLGIILSLEDTTTIFSKFDRNKNGRVNFNEFLLDLFPKDFSGVSWYSRRDQEQWAEAQRRKEQCLKDGRVGLGLASVDYPASMQKNRMTLDELERQIQIRIESRAPRPQVQFMTAYKMFGSPKDGLTPEMFRKQLWRMAIPCSIDDCNGLFQRYDSNGSGSMDFYEFIQGVMPTDYPVKSWNQRRDEEQWEDEQNASKKFEPVPKVYPRSMKNHQYSTFEIEQLLGDKLQGAARCDLVKYRRAYEVMGRPKGGVTYAIFQDKVLGMGIPARDDQLQELFLKYDVKKEGIIEFNELIRQILPKDYPTKTWTTIRGEQMANEEYARLVAGKANAAKAKYKPNMTLVRSRGNTPRSPTPRKKVPVTARGSGSGSGSRYGSGGRGKGNGSGRKSGSQTERSGGSRPVSRALAARLNSVERMNTARGNKK
jgi:Ca2+-binding EF-hand superfamily protein